MANEQATGGGWMINDTGAFITDNSIGSIRIADGSITRAQIADTSAGSWGDEFYNGAVYTNETTQIPERSAVWLDRDPQSAMIAFHDLEIVIQRRWDGNQWRLEFFRQGVIIRTETYSSYDVVVQLQNQWKNFVSMYDLLWDKGFVNGAAPARWQLPQWLTRTMHPEDYDDDNRDEFPPSEVLKSSNFQLRVGSEIHTTSGSYTITANDLKLNTDTLSIKLTTDNVA